MASLSEVLEEERLRLQEQEKRLRQSECESRAAQMSWADERQRLTSLTSTLEAQVAALEDAKEKDKAGLRPGNSNGTGRGLYRKIGDDDSSTSSGSVVMVLTEEEVRLVALEEDMI